jgi:hypothetical protein
MGDHRALFHFRALLRVENSVTSHQLWSPWLKGHAIDCLFLYILEKALHLFLLLLLLG